MNARRFHFHSGKTGAALAVRVTPKASRNKILGILDDGTVKISLTAPLVDGQANEALVKFLAEVLDVPKSNIEVVAGATGRDKLVSIVGLDASAVNDLIMARL
mgnify:FL=1